MDGSVVKRERGTGEELNGGGRDVRRDGGVLLGGVDVAEGMGMVSGSELLTCAADDCSTSVIVERRRRDLILSNGWERIIKEIRASRVQKDRL